jgi:hypothetical protein
MADKSRIPTDIPGFNMYISSSDDYQQATRSDRSMPNSLFLGWNSINSGDWANKRAYWRDVLYKKYSDPAQSTSIIKKDVKIFITDFHTFGNPLLDIAAANPGADTQDEEELHFKKKSSRKKPTHPHTRIEDKCFTTWLSEGGGSMKASSRSSHDTKRPSLAEGADSVQYAWKIMETKPTTAGRTAVPATNPAPQHPDDGTRQEVFTKATHDFRFGADKEGKFLCVWTRWYNTKHPELAGDWSQMQVVMIS